MVENQILLTAGPNILSGVAGNHSNPTGWCSPVNHFTFLFLSEVSPPATCDLVHLPLHNGYAKYNTLCTKRSP